MSFDADLREGLQRSMAKLDIEAELRLTDARRRGRRRVLARRVAVAVSVAASLALVTCPLRCSILHSEGTNL